MNEPKHTPGPYRLVRETDDSRPCRLYVRAGNRTLLASAEDTPEVAAQFQLFAAAPEMLEALEYIAGLYDDGVAMYELANNLYAASNLAYLIIAKAEGRDQEVLP